MRSALAQRLHDRIGAQVFEGALRDYATGRLGGRHMGGYVAHLLSLLVLLLPFTLIGTGIAVALYDFPNLLVFILAAILLWAGWLLVPRRYRSEPGGFTQADLPKTFALIDRVAGQLGTEAPDRLYLDTQFNASIGTPVLARRRSCHMTIGLPLWEALTWEERIALIGHELAHRVNGDPARTGATALGLCVLEDWRFISGPSRLVYDDGEVVHSDGVSGIFADIIMGALTVVSDGLAALIEQLSYLDRQRAEYLADALATEAAGTAAMRRVLEVLELIEEGERHIKGLSARNRLPGAEVLTVLGRALRSVPADIRDRIRSDSRKRRMSVDSTHPPTVYRLAFIESLRDRAPSFRVDPEVAAAIDAEMAEPAAKVADALYREIARQ